MKDLHLCHDWILFRKLDREATTAAGIVIPDTVADEPVDRGEVLSIGPGIRSQHNATLIPHEVECGDHIVYLRHQARPLTVAGEDLLLLRAGEVLAIERGGTP